MTAEALDDVQINWNPASFGNSLGVYYIDLTPAISLVKSGYHGPIDDTGVPLNHNALLGKTYNVVTIAQYALALHDKMSSNGTELKIDSKLRAQLNAII